MAYLFIYLFLQNQHKACKAPIQWGWVWTTNGMYLALGSLL